MVITTIPPPRAGFCWFTPGGTVHSEVYNSGGGDHSQVQAHLPYPQGLLISDFMDQSSTFKHGGHGMFMCPIQCYDAATFNSAELLRVYYTFNQS